jgi:GTP-binding protein EngB required for normal cell division
MKEIIKEYLKLHKSLMALPIKAARKIAVQKDEQGSRFFEFAEEIVTMPFNMAAGTMDKLASETVKNIHSKACTSGPNLKNALVEPTVSVLSDIETAQGDRRTVLLVTGLLCGG